MADLTVDTIRKLTENMPLNAKLMIRQETSPGVFESVEVGLIAYSQDNEFLFLAAPDV
jgi:hypothetical protein